MRREDGSPGGNKGRLPTLFTAIAALTSLLFSHPALAQFDSFLELTAEWNLARRPYDPDIHKIEWFERSIGSAFQQFGEITYTRTADGGFIIDKDFGGSQSRRTTVDGKGRVVEVVSPSDAWQAKFAEDGRTWEVIHRGAVEIKLQQATRPDGTQQVRYEGPRSGKFVLDYDAKNRLVACTWGEKGQPAFSVERATYNDRNDVTRVESRSSAQQEYEYVYDQHGHWINRIDYVVEHGVRRAEKETLRRIYYGQDIAPSKPVQTLFVSRGTYFAPWMRTRLQLTILDGRRAQYSAKGQTYAGIWSESPTEALVILDPLKDGSGPFTEPKRLQFRKTDSGRLIYLEGLGNASELNVQRLYEPPPGAGVRKASGPSPATVSAEPPVPDPKDSAEKQVRAVAARFIWLLKKGDVAGMKGLTSPGVNPATQKVIDQWVEAMAKSGPSLTDTELLPPGEIAMRGDAAIVQGGLATKVYLRLIRRDTWLVLVPGDAKAFHAASDQQLAQLSELESGAGRTWSAPREFPGKFFINSLELKKRAALEATKVAEDLFVAPAVKALVPLLDYDDKFSDRLVTRLAPPLALAGDLAAATAIFDTTAWMNRASLSGFLAAFGKKKDFHGSSDLFRADHGTFSAPVADNLARGLGYQGELSQVWSLPFDPKTVMLRRAIAASVKPTKDNLYAFSLEYPEGTWDVPTATYLVSGLIRVGDQAQAEKVAETARQKVAPNSQESFLLTRQMVDGYLRAGKRDAAMRLISASPRAGEMLTMLPRDLARAGDVAGVQAFLATQAEPGLQECGKRALIYALVKSNKADDAAKLCAEAKEVGSAMIRKGVMAAGLSDSGDKERARRTVEEALVTTKTIADRANQRDAVGGLLLGALFGVEYDSPHDLDFPVPAAIP